MAPGPVTTVTVGTGTRSPHTGALIAVGHGIVEFPLMVLIYYGLGDILKLVYFKATLFTLGGIFLLFMAFDMLRSIKHASAPEKAEQKKPLAAGIFLTLGNAYFVIWWATVDTLFRFFRFFLNDSRRK